LKLCGPKVQSRITTPGAAIINKRAKPDKTLHPRGFNLKCKSNDFAQMQQKAAVFSEMLDR